MSQTCLIETAIGQTRSALIGADGLPIEVAFFTDYSQVVPGVIATARITRVDKQLDMAFAALPEGKQGILSFRRAKGLGGPQAQTISDCVREGELVTVQVVADPSGLEDKALTLSARPKIVGRYLVAERGKPRLNFSKDIGPRPKKRLEAALAPFKETMALLVRSKAETVPPDALINEAKWLLQAFQVGGSEPSILFAPTPAERILLSISDVPDAILTNSSETLTELNQLTKNRWPDLGSAVSLYDGKDMMEANGVNEAIEEAIADRIELPCGGWISMHETPALTAIDVNMGGALAGRSAGDAQMLVNMEAAMAIFFHLRFQDIGGLIVVDFIDMKAKGAAAKMMDLVDGLVRDDPVPIRRTGISPLGLMEVSRKRTGISLRQRFLMRPTIYAAAEAAALDLLSKAERLGSTGAAGLLLMKSSPDVMTWLQDNDHLLDALEAKTHRKLSLEAGRITECAIKQE